MSRRFKALLIALVVLLGGGIAAANVARADTTTCNDFDNVAVSGGRYRVNNNKWNTAGAQQCISISDNGFRITSANHNVPTNGAPASYPSIYLGCHYTACSANSGLPAVYSGLGGITSSVSTTTTGGQWDSSYDIWFDPTPRTDGQNTGAELMIWLNHQGSPQPAGSKVATVNLAGASWDVWIGRFSWNVISYVRTSGTTSVSNLDVNAFVDDAANRGQINRNWYLTSIQYGFEPWQGGTGLAVNSFSANLHGSTGGGGGGGTGTVQIVGRGSNRCVDVNNGSTADGARVTLWDCWGGPMQTWRRSGNTFVNVATGKCLDVRGAATANGSQVWQWTCLNNSAQQWVVNSNGTVINPASGKCLDAVEKGTANGTNLQIWECGTPGPNQLWNLR